MSETTRFCCSVQPVAANDGEGFAVSGPSAADARAIKTVYPVFPGIEIIYNDIHTSRAEPQPGDASGILEINHCREGRVEYLIGEESFFLAPGDLSVSRIDCAAAARFPTGHYHGITVKIDTARSPDCLSCFLRDVDVRISVLSEKFCGASPWFAARSSSGIEHVFSELYHVPPEIRKGYFKVKILELLLFLSAYPVGSGRQSVSLSQVELARSVRDHLLENTEGKLTISALSRHFGASTSMINASFRAVYGMTPAAFLRTQKMHAAAKLLRESDRTILDVANQFSYDNASKFAKAFRSVIGVSPTSYRAGADMDSCAPKA
ncbi:MAG: helix-turn-helix transcriptional regulator [Oscillospiraceae bacterium]|nr:helix-turn-helix transcriptional regulator [Oscillospiraceae bacterium]